MAWLDNAEEMHYSLRDEDVQFFAALEVDGRGLEPYGDLTAKLLELCGGWWTFTLDDDTDAVTSTNRLVRICTGRNYVHEYAMRTGASHILFIDSDTRVPGNSIQKLLEVDHPVVGGEVPNYGLHGEPVPGFDFPVEEHWNTAGFLLIRREVFEVLRWRWTPDNDVITDDPCFQADQQVWGFGQTWVRKDVIGEHIEPLVPVEVRDADLKRH